ncbi:MAG: MBL fold metallo-hydrolase [Alphaproteobacteria bacterium]|nr:MBL fold metallo-hydrolase [Alphaproteobacteria bacterium]
MGTGLAQPTPDQLEVTVIGPGYGESSVVHVGGGEWVIIDSCRDSSTGEAAPLAYLRSIGVDVSRAVKLVVASHWHDDHIRGLAEVVRACGSAKFCCAAALGSTEFLANIIPYDNRHMIEAGSGASEIIEILNLLRSPAAKRPAVRAIANGRILALHGVEVWALSPSHGQFDKFLQEIGKLVPIVGVTKHRIPDQGPNHLSVVVWIKCGDVSMLFGGDLEETTDPETGWSVIVSSTERPAGRASIFKIPHHGSKNAHNDNVWREMLVDQPHAALTPYNRGSKLPTQADVARIVGLTGNSYSTANTLLQNAKRPVAVEKEIKLTVKSIGTAQHRTGATQFRNGGLKNPHVWTTKLFQSACPLTAFKA